MADNPASWLVILVIAFYCLWKALELIYHYDHQYRSESERLWQEWENDLRRDDYREFSPMYYEAMERRYGKWQR